MTNKYGIPLADLEERMHKRLWAASKDDFCCALIVAMRLARTRMNDADRETWLAEILNELEGAL